MLTSPDVDMLSPASETAAVDHLTSAAQRLRLAQHAPDDQPWGVANIHACLLLVECLTEEGSEARAQVREVLGMSSPGEFATLLHPERKLVVLSNDTASNVMPKTPVGREAVAQWKHLGASIFSLGDDPEGQVNALVKKALHMTDDLFSPGSFSSSSDEEILLVLLALERIRVQHLEQLPEYKDGLFQTPESGKVEARYAWDPDRVMTFVNVPSVGPKGGGGVMVQVPSKPDAYGGRRSLLFFLPDDDQDPNDLDAGLEALAALVQEGPLKWRTASFDFAFPCFDATHPVASVVKAVEDMGAPDLFDPSKRPFDESLPQTLLESDMPAIITKILHYASFKADRKGAEAKAVTVAVVATYRSIGAPPPPPVRFHCDRPFIVILADGEGPTFRPEFVLKVKGECLVRP